MRMVTAFIRTDYSKEICKKLVDAGVKGLSMSRIKGMGQGLKWAKLDTYGHTKLEIMVREEQLDEIIDVLIDSAWTGVPGDGVIAIHPLEKVIRIRTREVFYPKGYGGAEDAPPGPEK